MKYPWIFIFSTITLVCVCSWAYLRYRYERPQPDKSVALLANTHFITALPEYKKAAKKYAHLLIIDALAFLVCLGATSTLVARPLSAGRNIEDYQNNDIMICINTASYDEQTGYEFFSTLQNEITGLKGQRVGLTIFDDFALRLLPLSNDYIALREHSDNFLQTPYIYAKQLHRQSPSGINEQKQSRIGEGIAACINNFDRLDEENRSRSLILLSKAEDDPNTRISVAQAAEYAKLHDVHIYAINTYDNKARDFTKVQEGVRAHDSNFPQLELYKAALVSSGDYFLKCYDANEDSCPEDRSNIPQIIETIARQEAERGVGLSRSSREDIPQSAAVVLLVSALIFVIISWRLKI